MDGKEILVPIVMFSMVGFVLWVVISAIRKVLIAKMQSNVHTRMIDKFGSADSLIAFGATEPGQQFLTSLVEERAVRTSPYRSILSGVQAGMVLFVFGLTLLWLHHNGTTPADAVVVFGAIPVALAVGLWLAAGSTYLLSSKFGLLKK
jgi:hypothetical protein